MPLSYYTIDDMSLPRKGMLRKGWSVQHFDNLEEAIRSYREISLSKDKRLGLTDSIHTLELVRCVPLVSFDAEGEGILASDYRQYPLWADLPEAKSATQTCIKQFSLRYQFCSEAIMPLPRSNRLPKHLRDKYLWLSINHDPDSAIRWVYIGGTGWVPLEEWKRHASWDSNYGRMGWQSAAIIVIWRSSPGNTICWFAAPWSGFTKIHQRQGGRKK